MKFRKILTFHFQLTHLIYVIQTIYKSSRISERHRHRYEVNVNFRKKFEKKGLIFSGMSNNNKYQKISSQNYSDILRT